MPPPAGPSPCFRRQPSQARVSSSRNAAGFSDSIHICRVPPPNTKPSGACLLSRIRRPVAWGPEKPEANVANACQHRPSRTLEIRVEGHGVVVEEWEELHQNDSTNSLLGVDLEVGEVANLVPRPERHRFNSLPAYFTNFTSRIGFVFELEESRPLTYSPES